MTDNFDTKGLDQLPSGILFNVNLRYALSRPDWDTIRHYHYSKMNSRCESCGAENKPLHCHEQWSYLQVIDTTNDTVTVTQELVKLVVLCEDCHALKHMGLVSVHVQQGMPITPHIQHFLKLNPRCKEAGFWKAYENLQKRNSALAYLLSTKWVVVISDGVADTIKSLLGYDREAINHKLATLVSRNKQ
jgi:hypothetical protein